MSTAMPQVPPRPQRLQEPAAASGATLGSEMPKIPPRPINRRVDRSISPHRESFARSPLNETPFLTTQGNSSKHSSYSSEGANTSASDLPRRPPSVVLPSIGQEGNEYAGAFEELEVLGTSPTQTRNIAGDLKHYQFRVRSNEFLLSHVLTPAKLLLLVLARLPAATIRTQLRGP